MLQDIRGLVAFYEIKGVFGCRLDSYSPIMHVSLAPQREILSFDDEGAMRIKIGIDIYFRLFGDT